jgi:hypothetical protein
MKNGIFLFILIFSIPVLAEEKAAETVELIPPIAKEREDGLDKLPAQVFTDSDGLETWFVEERGFGDKAKNIATKPAAPVKAVRSPATKKNQKVEKRNPNFVKIPPKSRVKKKKGVKK